MTLRPLQVALRVGALPARDRLPRTHLNGVAFRRDLPTRWEEFAFVWQTLQWIARDTPILDAGSGFDPSCHVLPEILAAGGFTTITALDQEATSLQMPTPPGVTRVLGDLTQLPQVPDASVGAYCSVSVLEHLDHAPRQAALRAAWRVLGPGGLLLVTMDEIDPAALHLLILDAGFACGSVVPLDGDPLHPSVAYAVAQKPR